MAYLVRELIIRSWYLSGIVAEGYQTVTGPQIATGLRLLNEFLSFLSVNQRQIPYFSLTTITLEAGEEKYNVPGLVDVESNTFTMNNIRFSMTRQSSDEYFATSRVQQLSSLPITYCIQRVLGGSDIYLYPFPNSDYPLQVRGKYALGSVALEDDLEETIEENYIMYLRYALAKRICSNRNLTFSPQNDADLALIEKAITDIAPLDLTGKKLTSFGNPSLINLAVANLSGGWVP